MKMVWMLAFMLLPLLGMAYIGWHVWVLLPTTWIWKTLAIAVMVVSFLLLFLNMGRRFDGLPLGVASALYEVGTSSIFVMLYLVLLFLMLDLGRLAHVVPRTLLYNNGWTALGITVFMFGLFLYGNLHYRHKYREALTIHSPKVTRPVRLLMASDLHLGYHNRRAELARWVDMMNAEQPDLILIAGDIIDGSLRPLLEEDMAQEMRRLKAPVYACLGNHEFYAGEADAQRFYYDAGIHLLQDGTATVGDLCIIGRDDRTNMRRQSVADLMKQADRSKYTILLDHQPYHLEKAEKAGVDFQFSGHTHHGQVWPISWITDAIYECAFGSWKRGHTDYYVSSGLGIWGGKFRIGTRSEYVVVEIEEGGYFHCTLLNSNLTPYLLAKVVRETTENKIQDNPVFSSRKSCRFKNNC